MPYNSETETFYQAPATVVDSTPDGDTVQEGFDDRLTPAMAGVYTDLNLLKENGMIGVGIPATTTSRGIGRVATLADMKPGAEVTNGPAFLDVKGGVIATTPTAHAVPQAGADGKINKNWLSLDPPYNPYPSLSGVASFAAATNTITMTNIVTTLGLGVGDVVNFGGSANTTNAKLRTVEGVLNDNTIVVNYEHCGNRGNGSLKLSDQSGVSVTCTRIAKWYNAPIGLGQAWVNMNGLRVLGTTYTSSIGRAISIIVKVTTLDGASQSGLTINGIAVGSFSKYSGEANFIETYSALIPSGSSYSVANQVHAWTELR